MMRGTYALRISLLLLPDEISAMIAKANTAICHIPQRPSHHCITALYQSMVYGIKIKPSSGHIHVSNTPRNQWVNIHRRTAARRGRNRAIKIIIHIATV